MTYAPTHHDLGGFGDVAQAARAVVEDPCLFEVSTLVLRLNALTAKTPSRPGAPSPTPTRGIGLCKAVPPLRLVVKLKEQPWILPLAGLALVGGLFGLGYLAGRRRRR